jgi:hypothetical protein
MRDRRFVAEHRGGPLTSVQHRLLMSWACRCAEHVLPYFGDAMDQRLLQALAVGNAWVKDGASVGEACRASVACHTVAREVTDAASVAVARSVGHAVATAHMADHSLGAAWYGLKAVAAVGGSVSAERAWQDVHLPLEVKELVLSARAVRKGMK